MKRSSTFLFSLATFHCFFQFEKRFCHLKYIFSKQIEFPQSFKDKQDSEMKIYEKISTYYHI